MLARTLIASIATLLLWSPLAAAQDDSEENPYIRRGAYVGFGAAAAISTTTDAFQNEFAFDPDSSGGLYFEGGWRGNYLAAEIELTWVAEGNQLTILPAFRGYLPWLRDHILGGRIQPFLEVGAGPFYAETPRIGTVGTAGWGGTVKAGGGVDVYLTEDWVFEVTADYLHGTGRWHGWNRAGVGIGMLRRF